MPYPILKPAQFDESRAGRCALAVMAKAPRPGRVKTRLAPPLTLEQSAALNVCFLRDTTANLAEVCGRVPADGLISYTPVGDEALFEGILPESFALVAQRGDGFGERLLAAATDILACGYGSVCLIDSDSPTVPATAFERAVEELLKPGDRAVLGGSDDGGYYVIGLKRAHPEPFAGITWSTGSVYAETVAAIRAAGIELVELPVWYDVDDAGTLAVLRDELLHAKAPAFTTMPGYPAPAYRGVSAGDGQRMNHWSRARAWQTNAALLLLGTGLLLLSKQLIAEYDNYTIGFSGVSGWSVVLYAAACLLIQTQPVDRYTFPLILTVAVACRLMTLFAEPFLSSDVYRYVWDGIVQHAHISPFRYVPGDPALTFLREPNLEVFNNINRRDYAPTIYPPAAQLLFYVVTFFSPTVTAMKTALVLMEGLTLYGLARLLRELGVRRERTLLYAWCPLLIWEIAGSGHLDAAVMAFVVFALLARQRNRPVATGVFLALAVLTKLYPLVLFPALYRRGDWKMPATLAGLIAFGYACYSSVGLRVFGFFGGM